MSKYAEAITSFDNLGVCDSCRDYDRRELNATIIKALEIADRLERADARDATSNYCYNVDRGGACGGICMECHTPVDFKNGYEQALKDVRGEVMAEYINTADIVRCGECKHIDKTICLTSFPEKFICKIDNKSHTVDWFCADGEKK